jgi:hypothetical protein
VRWESSDAGPDSEVEYWRRRMQRLTAIIEQIKSKGCQTVITFLATVARMMPLMSSGAAAIVPQKNMLIDLMRRWKGIDLSVTEAANEVRPRRGCGVSASLSVRGVLCAGGAGQGQRQVSGNPGQVH